ncbi:hypothetical protein ABE82_26250 (plasmid) [Paenibacillus peoriae]|uniref:hypothetical protein n=1 Tax=Paenibacillus peoriae TaxID=59893 RepID=UPI0007230BA8|nr:hypothetical protein [Paenibacillus peoriae]ALS09922.1 hypothetical protein ABE82_26250 [Paenibacillus peoriae]
MSQYDEYAKFVKVQANPAGRGIQASITLPSSVTFKGNTSNYVNFYLGGFLQAECGLSYRKGQAGFRWFANDHSGLVGAGSYGEFSFGQTVHLKLAVDEPDANNPSKALYVRFYVNGSEKVKYTYKTYTRGQTVSDLRLILAGGTNVFSRMPSTMPAWEVYHTQVTATDLQIKNAASNTWTALTNSNASPTKFHWPIASGTSTPVPCPSPQDYILDTTYLSSSRVYASLK